MEVTAVIPTIGRDTLGRAVISAERAGLDVVVEPDTWRTGPGPTRNRGITRVDTEWTAFLDDDDRFTPDYGYRLLREIADHDPDVVIFKLIRPDGYKGMWPDKILPREPKLIRGNVGINFACRTELAKEFPFTHERFGEDSIFLETLEEAGAKITFSNHITYLVR